MSYLNLVSLAMFSAIASGCTNNITQNTYTQSTAQTTTTQASPTPKTTSSISVPHSIVVPMSSSQRQYESGTLAGGSYFYRRYQSRD